MIRSFVFDIGNVLLPFDLNRAISAIQRQSRVALDSIRLSFEPIKIAYETGRIGREAFLDEVIGLVDYTGSREELIAAWENIFEENTAMARLVRALHGKYPLFLLSNTNDLHVAYMLRQYPVFQCFTDAVYSHVACCFKPDTAIYRQAERQFNLIPSETVFLDDLPPNIAAAKALGWHAIQYDYRNHNALMEELRRLGIEEV